MAGFLFAITINHCLSTKLHKCGTCAGSPVRPSLGRYTARLSGPLLDRIDLHVEVPALSYDELAGSGQAGPTSADVREMVQPVRETQRERYGGHFACNAHLDAAATRKHCKLADGADTLLQKAIYQLGFSARAYDKVFRVARTVADLGNSAAIESNHVAEAIQYRSLDQQLFQKTIQTPRPFGQRPQCFTRNAELERLARSGSIQDRLLSQLNPASWPRRAGTVGLLHCLRLSPLSRSLSAS